MAVGGRYHFAVPDRAAAEALADALAEAGFPQTGARPLGPQGAVPATGWEVQAIDEGPYPTGPVGDRQRAAAGRRARAIARAHGGSLTLMSLLAVGGGGASLHDAGLVVVRTNPGSRPPVPLIRAVPAPPPGQLSLSPDSPVRTLTRPDGLGLGAVAWHELTHAHGPADDIPALITSLSRPHRRWHADYGELLSRVLHQGTCYPASGPALVVLARLVTASVLPAAERRDIYLTLLWTAGLYREDIIELTEYAAARGQPPRPGRWAGPVQDAVGSVTPGLLARWASEPSAGRLALAALAATFPGHGGAAAGRIASMAGQFAGTQVGACARLAHGLVTADTAGAFATACEIASWHDGISVEAVDDESVPPGLRALDILCQAVTAASGPVG